MPRGDSVPVLICPCGRRLKAPGATPGRVGRCPSCGASLRVPERREPAAAPRPASDPAAGYTLAPAAVAATGPAEEALPGRAPVGWDGPRASAGPIGRGGLLPLADRAETGLGGSLLYPFRDGLGLACLTFWPPLLAFGALSTIGLIPQVAQGGNRMIVGPFAFGMIVVFAAMIGWTLSVLGEFLAASARGQSHHPGWPDVDLFAILGSLLRWLVALGSGLGPALVLGLGVWEARGYLGLVDRVAVAALIGVGLLYAPMALVAVTLFDDPRAARPGVVLPAILLAGRSYLAACVVGDVALLLGALAIKGVYLPGPFWATLLACWAASAFLMYEAIVVVRLLGLCYHRNARRLGWFPERPTWGAS